jgi:hypothetical protein
MDDEDILGRVAGETREISGRASRKGLLRKLGQLFQARHSRRLNL